MLCTLYTKQCTDYHIILYIAVKLFLTLINTAPFGTLIPPGVVPIMLHTCCASQVAHLYDAGVFRSPNKGFPANFLETSEKLATWRAILGHL